MTELKPETGNHWKRVKGIRNEGGAKKNKGKERDK